MIATADAPRTAAAAPAAAAPADPFESHFEEVFFETSAFGGRRVVPEIESTFRGEKLEKEMVSTAQAILIPPELERAVQSARTKLYKLISTYCLPGDGQGCYYVSTRKSEEFIAKFAAARDAYGAAADAIALEYDRIVAFNRAKWLHRCADEKDYEQKIGRHLPASAEALRACYAVTFRPTRKGGKPEGAGRYKAGPIRDWFEAAHRQAIEHEHESRRGRYREIFDRLAASADDFRKKLEEGTKIQPKSFTRWLEAMSLFRVCADIVSPEAARAVEETAAVIESAYNRASQALRTGRGFGAAIRNNEATLRGVLDRLVGACEEATSTAVLAEKFGKMPARLVLRPGLRESDEGAAG